MQAATEQAMQSHRSAIERMAAELSKSHDETIDPDNLVSAQSPLHTQLVGCVAEHAAIEDTLFYLSKALAKKLIPLQDYLTVCGWVGPTVKCRWRIYAIWLKLPNSLLPFEYRDAMIVTTDPFPTGRHHCKYTHTILTHLCPSQSTVAVRIS
jgi:hypothetical protein